MKPKKVAPRQKKSAPPSIAEAPVTPPTGIRVFLSYSHADKALVTEIAAVLRDMGMKPMWDRDFRSGHGFHDQIRSFIAHAHVFMPVLTEIANARNWVHQEIGYALALNTPVVPLAVGKFPGEMLQHLQAVRVDPGDVTKLRERLPLPALRDIVTGQNAAEQALYLCAGLPEERATLMARMAEDVARLGEFGCVRQKGGLSSFHIPTVTLGHSAWKVRYGPVDRGVHHCQCQREERLALGRHAEAKGCRLIINSTLTYLTYGPAAKLVRLGELRDFLRAQTDTKCEVAENRLMDHPESVTLVGDWFAAESVSAVVGGGYLQTIFTRHAPTLLQKITHFDGEFDELLAQAKTSRRNSRRVALQRIEAEMAKLR